MSELFVDEEDELVEGEPLVVNAEEVVDAEVSEVCTLDARRRLEDMLEKKRLREELDDFIDY